ncbi:MAG TPA: hypothetical protein P5276_02995 [Candidatus Paceibacterota bacterium]|nr:hypothetical protein [Candidatus Paceibacterota bacterium]
MNGINRGLIWTYPIWPFQTSIRAKCKNCNQESELLVVTSKLTKVITVFILFLIVSLLVAGIYMYYRINTADGVIFDTNNAADNSVVGGDKDEHGCIGSAGYTWCEVKNKCLRSWEEECETENETPVFSDKTHIEQEIVHRETGNKILVVRTDNEEYVLECITKPNETGDLPDRYLSSYIKLLFMDNSGGIKTLDEKNVCLYNFDSITFSPDGKYVSFRTYGFEYYFYSLINLETFVNLNKDTDINFDTIKWDINSSMATIESRRDTWLQGRDGKFVFDAGSESFKEI